MIGTHDNPNSRVEAILQNILGEQNKLDPPSSRIEELLLAILEQGSVGGGCFAHFKEIFYGDAETGIASVKMIIPDECTFENTVFVIQTEWKDELTFSATKPVTSSGVITNENGISYFNFKYIAPERESDIPYSGIAHLYLFKIREDEKMNIVNALKDFYVSIGGNYSDVENINEIDELIEAIADFIHIPTNLSELTEDAAHRTVSDSEKQLWNSVVSKAEKSEIPTSLSSLSEDALHRLVTDSEKNTWNNKAGISDTQYYNHFVEFNYNSMWWCFNYISKSAIAATKISDVPARNVLITGMCYNGVSKIPLYIETQRGNGDARLNIYNTSSNSLERVTMPGNTEIEETVHITV